MDTCHVKLDDVLPEEDVSDEQPLHAIRRWLYTRLVGLGKVPALKGNLPRLLANGHPGMGLGLGVGFRV